MCGAGRGGGVISIPAQGWLVHNEENDYSGKKDKKNRINIGTN